MVVAVRWRDLHKTNHYMANNDKPTVRLVRKHTIARRRMLVSMLYLTGQYTQEAIVDELRERHGIETSQETVSFDLKYLNERAAEDAMQSTQERIQKELRRLAHLEALVTANLSNEVYISEGNPLDLVEAIEEVGEQQNRSHEKATELLLKIGIERRKLLGLDAPKKVAVEGGDLNKPIRTTDLSDDELEQIILASAVKAADQNT